MNTTTFPNRETHTEAHYYTAIDNTRSMGRARTHALMAIHRGMIEDGVPDSHPLFDRLTDAYAETIR